MTDRISSFHSSPATTFYLESDPIAVDWDNNRTLVRNRLRAMNGPGGSTGSYYGGSGNQIGYINGWEFGRHSGHPFLPSGYSNGAIRWNDGPWDVWIGHDGNGNASVNLQMSLVYGNVNVHPTASYGLARIGRAPGAPGQPSVSNITPTSVTLSWSAASRGHADITNYQWQIATDSGFGNVVVQATGGVFFSDNTADNGTLNPGTGYFARVRALNADGWGAWSTSRSFTTLPSTPPGVVVTPSPAGSSVLVSLTPPGGITGVDKYTVTWQYLSPAPIPNPSTWSQETTTSQLNVQGLTPGVTYRWTATATIGGYTSPASAAQDVAQPQPSTGAGDYFDGSTPAKTDTTYAWTGTANNSTSTMSGLAVTGWQALAIGGGDLKLMRATGGLFGFYSARADITHDLGDGVTAPSMRVGIENANPYRTEAEPFTTYVGSIHVNPSRQQRLAAEISWVDGSGTLISRAVGPSTLVAQGMWQRLVVTAEAPALTAYALIRVVDVNGAGWSRVLSGDWFLVDGAMISLGELFPYFDGDTPDTLNFRYDWTGAANASDSTRTALESSVDPLADPDCPPIPAPPRPPIVPSECIADVGLWRRYWVYIPAEEVSDWLSSIPTLELETGAFAERQVRIRMYPNPFERSTDEVEPDEFCSEQIISYIPPNTTLTLDGVTERVRAEVAGSAPISGDHLLYGSNGTPATWPILSCGVSYWVSLDVPNEAPAGNLQVRVYMTQRT